MLSTNDYDVINASLEQHNKAIIGIGCSFVAGMGAWHPEIFQDFSVTVDEAAGNRCVIRDQSEVTAVKEKYKIASGPPSDNNLNWSAYEKDNAFVDVLANKYLTDHTPINLGMSGNGNRSSASQLFLHPQINWDKIQGGAIVYCPSGMDRFDFANDQGIDYGHSHICTWPGGSERVRRGHFTRDDLSGAYGNIIYSEKSAVIEQLGTVQTITMFAKMHNMQLIITPGFDERYSSEEFTQFILEKIDRDAKGRRIANEYDMPEEHIDRLLELVKLFPWDNVFKPDGQETFIDLCLKQEGLPPSTNCSYFGYLHKGSPNHWVSPCAHPTALGHDLFAHHLFNAINRGGYNV